MELDEFIANVESQLLGQFLQGLEVSGGEAAEGVVWIGQRPGQLIKPPNVGLQVLLVFRIHSLQFTVQ